MTLVAAAELRAGSLTELRCGQMVHGGLCVAHAGGMTVLVSGAIPGELVEARLHHRKGRTWFADTVRALEPSPHRVAAPCPYVPECGGCQLQHVTYREQLNMKRGIVLDALRGQRVPAPATIAMRGMHEPWRYRIRGEFHLVPGTLGARDAGLGFNRARSWRPIAVDDCLIHERVITDALSALRDMVHESAHDDLGTLHLTLGDGGGELLVRAKPQRALPAAAIDTAATRMRDGCRVATEATTLRWRDHVYRVTPDSFVQVNAAQMEVLYECALRGLALTPGRRVVDAYAGIGVLAVHLASLGVHVVCVESNRAAARMGVLNSRLNGVGETMRYELADVEHALPRVAAGADALLLDPPRAGCGGQVTAWIALAGPQRVVYVSCDPATLARDLHVLVASGPYRLEAMDLVDMFPQTHHVETVTTLVREDNS